MYVLVERPHCGGELAKYDVTKPDVSTADEACELIHRANRPTKGRKLRCHSGRPTPINVIVRPITAHKSERARDLLKRQRDERRSKTLPTGVRRPCEADVSAESSEQRPTGADESARQFRVGGPNSATATVTTSVPIRVKAGVAC